jgi:hypothetical protein
MSLRGVHITEGEIGINVSGDSREFGLICTGVAVVDKLVLGTHYVLRRVSDAVALGINADYDITNSVNCYRHISEFYRMAGEGKKLNLIIVGQDVPFTSDNDSNMITIAKRMVAESTLISDIAFARTPGSLTSPINGLDPEVNNAIAPMQSFAQWCDDNDMPLHVILEGFNITTTIANLLDLRHLAVAAPKVTIVIGQDNKYAQTVATNCAKYADVGTFLGCIAAQSFNRNPGEVETMNITDSVLGIFTVGGLSNGLKYTDVFEQLATLDDKGYVFPIRYTGLSGYWWNDGHCCVEVIVDAYGNMNAHEIYYSHCLDQSKRALRIAYMPEVKVPVALESDGKLGQDMIDYYTAIGDMVFSLMEGKSLISKGKTTVDPNSDLLVAKELIVGFGVVPTGMTGEINGFINLKTNI